MLSVGPGSSDERNAKNCQNQTHESDRRRMRMRGVPKDRSRHEESNGVKNAHKKSRKRREKKERNTDNTRQFEN